MARHRWAYFLTDQELIDVYKECGGKIGTFNARNFDDVAHARRGIFEYLMPGHVRVWYASLDDQDGMVFFIGKPTLDIHQSVKRDFGKRCWDMFERAPNPCVVLPDSLGLKWDLFRDGVKCRLNLLEFLQSDRRGDMYPLSQEQLALIHGAYK